MISKADLICVSHLRWGFVYQRPQHLMTRFAKEFRVFYVEEPVFAGGHPRIQISEDPGQGVRVVVPTMAAGLPAEEVDGIQSSLLDDLVDMAKIERPILWYYTPMALGFTSHLQPRLTIYDCMDELRGFKGAPAGLVEREQKLFACADLVFTGGQSLYELKREQHPAVYAFPSSVDAGYFGQARIPQPEPVDQSAIPHPRVGYCGVIDERMDLELLARIAELRPDWHFVMVGPVVKIDPVTLPKLYNIHYLGAKEYKELPQYMAGWDAAMLPFARNESTRFVSPTKIPEYLAAGLPTVSTSIRDVVRPYGEMGTVGIANDADGFVAAVEMELKRDRRDWLSKVDALLQNNSWDKTWSGMMELITARLENIQEPAQEGAGVRNGAV